FAILSLHLLNQFERMAGSGRNSGPRLYITDDIQTEMFRKVGKRAVIGNDFAPTKWLHFRVPFLLRRSQALRKILGALLKVSGVCRIQVSQLASDAFGKPASVVRSEPVVRIPERMHISFGARDRTLRDFHDLGELGSVKVARGAHLNPGIA